MRCLITGGAGFIGSHIADEAARLGWEVAVLDDLSTGKRENLAQLEGRARLIVGDVADPQAVREAARGADVIFHLAALVSVPESVRDPQKSARVNDLGTLNVFSAAAETGARVIHSSSAAVYGPDAAPPHHEGLTPDPVTPYAAHKLLGEHYARFYHREKGLSCLCLRYFNVFGPRQDPSSPYSGVISIFSDRLATGRPATIFGDGEQTRDFVYVADVVAANFLAALHPVADGRATNVGTGKAVTLKRLWEELRAVTGLDAPLSHGPTREGDIRHSRADTSRARDFLAFEARTEFAEGLAKTIRVGS